MLLQFSDLALAPTNNLCITILINHHFHLITLLLLAGRNRAIKRKESTTFRNGSTQNCATPSTRPAILSFLRPAGMSSIAGRTRPRPKNRQTSFYLSAIGWRYTTPGRQRTRSALLWVKTRERHCRYWNRLRKLHGKTLDLEMSG